MIPKAKLVLGPPGCGKTTYLIDRIRDALTEGAHPSRIGVISFTRKAIEEMVTRACREFTLEPTDFPYMRTSHSFGFRGLGLQPTDIMKKEDYDSIGSMIGLTFEGKLSDNLDEGLGLPSIGGSGADYLQMVGRARLRMVKLETEFNEAANHDLFLPKLVQLHEQIEEYKRATNKFDYVDMIDKYIQIGEPPHLDYLFIDEAQDFTPLQWEMAEKIAAASDKVFIAGDDDQAIHRWTGVDVELFNECSNDIHVLDQSYRIPASVHRLAIGISKRIHGRHDKVFKPREDEGSVEWIHHLDEAPLHEGSWTLMARTNSYVQTMAKKVKEMGFKYSIKGRSSISDTLVANLFTWGDLCKDKKVGLQRIKDFYASVPKQGQNAVVKRGYQQRLDTLAPDAELTMDQLQQEFGLLVGAEQSGFEVLRVGSAEREYIAALYRRGDDLLSEPRIKISTFHAMKGGEDDNCLVWLASTRACAESEHPDDEHRAFYVGVTRARHNLYILQSSERYRYTI
jgi:superfamily I DNA/RNA helicase